MNAVLLMLRAGLQALNPWKQSCPAGEPVQAQHKCESACCPSHPVTTLHEGDSGVVSCLTDPEHPKAARLASLGILPGIPVRLVQRYPAYVIRVGFAEIALDEDLAQLVRVITGAEAEAEQAVAFH